MEEARAIGDAAEAGLEARSAPSSTARGTARSPACSAPPNGPRRMPTSCSAKPPSTSTPIATAAASCNGGLAHAGEIHQRRGARHRRSRDQALRVEAPAGRPHRNGARPTAPRPAAAPTCASARSARARTTPRSSTTSASRPSISVSAARTGGGIYHSIYDDFYWYTHFSDTRLRLRHARWRRPPAPP